MPDKTQLHGSLRSSLYRQSGDEVQDTGEMCHINPVLMFMLMSASAAGVVALPRGVADGDGIAQLPQGSWLSPGQGGMCGLTDFRSSSRSPSERCLHRALQALQSPLQGLG
ncbi:hypothetical protein D623_10000371 [Myotis brandtii]|uniref:Uncharacterized protein n=1 Tax=Myotis brandtii TaxID=109478 RepID=S7NSE8_MYOBR|nr:hypothetical protein D623_10000371 [Myotis brandtii]